MNSPVGLVCPRHQSPLTNTSSRVLACELGCQYPIINHIPRFVPPRNYATSFGLQWNTFRKTQLDSYTGTTISRDRLDRLVGGQLGIVRGQTVLEAGCGAGRFTEILLQAGAHVFACDLSTAVEANFANIGDVPNYFVCQADIASLPVLPESFDSVICIGVVQHTPDPEKTIASLCLYVRPGGLLVFDHYTYGYAMTTSRRWLRSLLVRTPAEFALRFCDAMVNGLWYIHRFLWRHHRYSGMRDRFLRLSPVVDYQDAYPQLSPEILHAWATLDTHDTLTDVYKHLRSADEITHTLRNCGMIDIETVYAGNGVEARARKPERRSN